MNWASKLVGFPFEAQGFTWVDNTGQCDFIASTTLLQLRIVLARRRPNQFLTCISYASTWQDPPLAEPQEW